MSECCWSHGALFNCSITSSPFNWTRLCLDFFFGRFLLILGRIKHSQVISMRKICPAAIFVRNSGYSHGRNLKQVDARNGRSSNHNGEQRSHSHQETNGFISPEPQSKIAYQPPVRFFIFYLIRKLFPYDEFF